MNTMDTVEARVARGVEWLDCTLPWWRQAIVAEELDMSDPRSGIVAQLFGDWTHLYRIDMHHDEIVDLGFDIELHFDQARTDRYIELRSEWIKHL